MPIVCLAYDRQTGLVATGAVGINPEICVWMLDKMKPIAKYYQGKGTKIVSNIKFIGARNVLTVDRESEANNNITVWALDGKKTTVKCPGTVYSVSTFGLAFAAASSKGAFTGKYSDNDLSITCIEEGEFSAVAHSNEDPIFGKPTGEMLFKG